jgi:hypothetical protein
MWVLMRAARFSVLPGSSNHTRWISPALLSDTYHAFWLQMRLIGKFSPFGLWLLFSAAQPIAFADTTNGAPDFKEVYDLVRAHAAGISEAELNRAALKGLISTLKPKVALVTSSAETTPVEAALVSKSSLFEGDIVYLRIGKVGEGLAQAVGEAYQKASATNKLKGIVLDLRYAKGDDYRAAADTADLFVSKERPLLNWGNGAVKSKDKKDAITLPVAVLVNRQTAAAAEALAGVLRETGSALILGGQTAGLAMITEEFPLKDGERLRIATAPVQLGDGSTLPAQGIKPDIAVDVSFEDERAYYADAFSFPRVDLAGTTLSLTNTPNGTNRARRNRINEADLVRERREGLTLDLEAPNGRDREPEAVVHDPTLARALDLLKGLAVVHQSRS